MDKVVNLDFYKKKKVLLTGHTGFKGSWMSHILINAGAELTGYSRCSKKEISLYDLDNLSDRMNSVAGDICDFDSLKAVLSEIQPEIVIHMAAQPIVRESYRNPLGTYSTNVMGTANILECVRLNPCVKSFLNVTTDKVYLNDERAEGFKEDQPLDGFDPYSNSKSCSELITHSYKNSFFADSRCAVSTARAGNVIGGGDFARDRIIPDCVRAAVKQENIIVRNPYSTRPYQHVLEPIMAYLMICEKQYENPTLQGWYNVGPDDCDCFETGRLVDTFIKYWGEGMQWENRHDGGPHEAGSLKLDSTKLKETFGWHPAWNLDMAIAKTVEWYKAWNRGENISRMIDRQVEEFING